MLKTYAVIRDVRPDDAKQVLEEMLAEEGLTGFTIILFAAVASGFVYRIEATETMANVRLLRRLYGEANLDSGNEEHKAPGRKRLEGKLQALPSFDARGKEGRFAREHRGGV